MARIRFPNGSSIDEAELEFLASRSHVGSSSLSDAQKRRVRDRLGNRITKDDVFIIQAGEERSQHQNREAAVARFRALVGEAITPQKQRRRTKVSRRQKRKRLEAKRRHSEKKQLRRSPKPPR